MRTAGGPELDKRKIEVKNPIKTVGSHQVTVRLHPEVSARLDIEVLTVPDGVEQRDARGRHPQAGTAQHLGGGRSRSCGHGANLSP